MFEIGAVVAARGEQHDHGIVRAAGRNGAQVLQQPFGIVSDRRHGLAVKGVREQPHHDLAVLQNVGHAGRRADIVLQHEEIALACPDEIDAGNVRVHVLG